MTPTDSGLVGVVDKSMNGCMGVPPYGFCADLAVVPEVSVLVFPPTKDTTLDGEGKKIK